MMANQVKNSRRSPRPGVFGHPLLRKLFGSSALSGLIKIGSSGLTFAFFAILAQWLTLAEFGIVAVGFSTAFILGSIASLGQEFSVLRFWPLADERFGAVAAHHTLIWSAQRVLMGGLLMLMVVAVFAAAGLRVPNIELKGRALIAVAALGAAIALSEFTASSLRAKGSVLWALVPRDIAWRILVLLAAFGLAIYSGAGVISLATGILLGLVVLQAGILWKSRGRANAYPLQTEITVQMRRALPGLWGIAVANSVGQHVATIIIGATLGPVNAAIFFAATRLSQLMAMFLLAINQVFGPMLSRSWAASRHREAWLLYLAASAMSFSGAFGVFLTYLFFGDWFLRLFGDAYVEGYVVLIILSIGQLINAACGPNRAFLMMVGYERPLLILVVASSLLLPLLLPFVATRYDMVGAAICVSAITSFLNLAALFLLFRIGIKEDKK